MSSRMIFACLFAGLVVPAAGHARELHVGPHLAYRLPSEAAAAAADGDTVVIDEGEYFDCAVWKANNLTIQGAGPQTVITDKTCVGKGIFVIDGNNATIRDLTLTRARVPDGNGAGIRAEGRDLTVVNVRFINNENGILSAPQPNGSIRVSGSTFERNGKCNDYCAHGIYVGDLRLLRIENSRFVNTRQGHHVKSRAQRTEIVGDTIEDGPDGTASFLVEAPNGGGLLVENSTFEKGPHAENHTAAIAIGTEGVTHPTPEIVVRNNSFTNDMGASTAFVRNLTATEAQLTGNRFKGPVTPLVGDGSSR